MNEEISSFLEEATQELLYNIVYKEQDEDGEIGYRELSEEFKDMVGYQPMDFFGLGNITGDGWFEFLRCSPGLWLDRGTVSIDEDEDTVYDNYNSNDLLLESASSSSSTVAEYRIMLLSRACKLIAISGGVLNEKWCKDDNGNTPLHLVAAMPGVGHDDPTLVEYLLNAGADPLQENKDGQNILHIIAGRVKAEDHDGNLKFGRERVHIFSWELGHRQELLNLLSEQLSSAHLAMLMDRPGRDGNTVMHEWVLSTSAVDLLKASTFYQQGSDLVVKEIKIASKLLSFGGNLKIPNKSGLVPLHYACYSFVFTFLLEQGAVCRSRNDRDETPFLFILKYFVALVFAYTSGMKEIEGFLDKRNKETNLESFYTVIKKAKLVSKHLLRIIEQSEEVRKTVWISDMEDITPLEIVLVCIRIASYELRLEPSLQRPNQSHSLSIHLEHLRNDLVELLNGILRTSNPSHLRRQNKESKGPLHILLDMGSNNGNKVIADEGILQSLKALIQNGADVNAVNAKGQTALDVTNKYMTMIPSLNGKCREILRKNGATVDLKSNSEKIGQAGRSDKKLHQILTSPVGNLKRKLRSCPQRHFSTANQLTKARNDITEVQKYRYLSQTPIGSGAFSSIFVAIKDEYVNEKSTTIDCRVIALKRMEKAKINPQEIKREVQALLSISANCENILNCYDSLEDEFFHYLVLDLMDGDLRQFIDDRGAKALMQSSTDTPIQAARDIINGLTYLHKNDFLHRDLKPGNILYTVQPSLHFKIGDFGLAKNVSSCSTMTSTKGGGVAGTPCWMAPELLNLKSREHTKESDVFTLGLVLHYLLTLGKHPFTGQKEAEEPLHVIHQRIVDMKISIDRSLPIESTSFIQVILAKNPSKRPPAESLDQHPFLWKEKKKIEFLKAVGDQPEAVNPSNFPNSDLERCLQKTNVGRELVYQSWDMRLPELFSEMTMAWKQKKYRTNYVIDLVRFFRNAYSHKEERSLRTKRILDNSIFFKKFPSLVLDVFAALQNAGFLDDETRSNIRHAMSMS